MNDKHDDEKCKSCWYDYRHVDDDCISIDDQKFIDEHVDMTNDEINAHNDMTFDTMNDIDFFMFMNDMMKHIHDVIDMKQHNRNMINVNESCYDHDIDVVCDNLFNALNKHMIRQYNKHDNFVPDDL